MPVLLPFVLWPLGEIAAFAMVGDRIGAVNTVLLVVAAGALGLMILRRQGLAALATLKNGDPAAPPPAGRLLDALAVTLAGLLLLLPGFLSDVVGLALLVPGVRQGLGAWLAARIIRSGGSLHMGGASSSRPPPFEPSPFDPAGSAPVIDVEFTDVTTPPAAPPRQVGDHRNP